MKRFKTLKSYTLYTLFVPFFLMVGCVEVEDTLKEKIITNGDDKISIIEVDSCEYILYDGWKAGGLTHKGNCKNH